jgi:hypothetical protein
MSPLEKNIEDEDKNSSFDRVEYKVKPRKSSSLKRFGELGNHPNNKMAVS